MRDLRGPQGREESLVKRLGRAEGLLVQKGHQPPCRFVCVIIAAQFPDEPACP